MNEQELLDGLRTVAAAEPREAPARVEEVLHVKFRARVERRRLAWWGSAGAGIAAMAAAVAIVSWTAPTRVHTNVPIAEEAGMSPAEETSAAVQYAVVRTDEVATSFYPLPQADALPPVETTMVVRVQLPMSSLRLMGVPVGEDFSGDSVQADVLLGQDGWARGVRLVQ